MGGDGVQLLLIPRSLAARTLRVEYWSTANFEKYGNKWGLETMNTRMWAVPAGRAIYGNYIRSTVLYSIVLVSSFNWKFSFSFVFPLVSAQNNTCGIVMASRFAS